MATDPWAIDASAGSPAYSGQEIRLLTVVPFIVGNGTSLGTRSGVRLGGSGTELLVQSQVSPNMTVRVQPGIFVAQGQISTTQGSYTWCLDAVTNLTIAASHATLARTDLVCVRVRDASIDTSGARDGNVVVITGTNGGGVPSLPTDASYYTLAQISVPAAVTTIGGGGGGTITDKRTFVAALGGVIPCTSSARPANPAPGQPIWETDTLIGSHYDPTAAAFRPYSFPSGVCDARYRQNAAQSIANSTDTLLQFQTAEYTGSDIVASGTGNTTFTLNRTGLWLITAGIRYPTTGGEKYMAIVKATDFTVRYAHSSNPGSGASSLSCSTMERLTSGAQVGVYTWQNSGGALSTDVGWPLACHIAIRWLGP